jgi:hypothetical protein
MTIRDTILRNRLRDVILQNHMNKNSWIVVIVIAIVVGGAGFWGGMTYAQNQAPSARTAFTGAAAGRAGFAGRAGGTAGGATFGTIISIDPTSITIQLPASTSTATSGTKIVLYDSSTQIQQLQSVPASNLVVGQSVTVTGAANADGSVTATSIQIRPTGAGRAGSGTPTSGQ